ncbi:unnamed protein product [Vicia faba]|uniref:Uncharacterized protein n=1 Tax=Vicia faba TaxID=3906 RepID=A0AAV1AN40_VICFA|nr:unnamed protein product [Vicia faba]
MVQRIIGCEARVFFWFEISSLSSYKDIFLKAIWIVMPPMSQVPYSSSKDSSRDYCSLELLLLVMQVKVSWGIEDLIREITIICFISITIVSATLASSSSPRELLVTGQHPSSLSTNQEDSLPQSSPSLRLHSTANFNKSQIINLQRNDEQKHHENADTHRKSRNRRKETAEERRKSANQRACLSSSSRFLVVIAMK